jgi:hypothetical protein
MAVNKAATEQKEESQGEDSRSMVTLDPFSPKKNPLNELQQNSPTISFCVMKIHHKRKLYSLLSYYMRFSNLNQCYLVLDFERNQVWFWFLFIYWFEKSGTIMSTIFFILFFFAECSKWILSWSH